MKNDSNLRDGMEHYRRMEQKIVIYTQRVEIVESYGERRDCADQNIPCFLETCGYLPIPVPNVLKEPAVFAESLHPCGIVLTGGNSLEKYGGAAPERDRTDSSLIAYAIKNGIPLYGFCRGMQSILDFFGCRLQPVKHHVAVRHHVHGIWGEYEVNSYHNQACMEVVDNLEVTAWAEDGVVEAVVSREYPIMATMWHPERENPFLERDLKRVGDFLKNRKLKSEVYEGETSFGWWYRQEGMEYESDHFSSRSGNKA